MYVTILPSAKVCTKFQTQHLREFGLDLIKKRYKYQYTFGFTQVLKTEKRHEILKLT